MLLHQLIKLTDKIEHRISQVVTTNSPSPLRNGMFKIDQLKFVIPQKSALWFTIFEVLATEFEYDFEEKRYWVEED